MSIPPPPPPSGTSTRMVVIIAAATFVLGVGVGVVASSSDDSEPAAAASAGPTLESETGAEATLPPAEGAEPEPSPSAETSGVGASLDNPVPVGEGASVGEWTVKVVGYTPNATEAVHRENSFNEKAGPGEQYVLVTLRTTYEGTGSADPWSDQAWSVVSTDGTLTEEAGEVWPNDLAQVGRVPSGVSGVGNVGFLVRSSDVPGLTLYIEADTPDFETEGAFFALS